jgi:hypothetical protein
VGKKKASKEASLGEAALEYAVAHGIPVFPLHGVNSDLSCTCGRQCGQPGKHPRTPHGHKDATADPVQIKKWWKRWPDANIGTASDTLVSAFLDENNNMKLDSNLFGLPTELYGFSRNARNPVGPPPFEAAAFRLASLSSSVRDTQPH